jgi:phosphoribosylamine---glycine ligase
MVATTAGKALVLGGGGREHALAWALGRSASVSEVVVAPGNAGTARDFRNVSVAIDDPAAVVELAKREGVDLVVVGPEAPLCAGVVDALTDAGIAAFGPTAAAARLEGSKAFMKRFAADNGIPTAAFLITSDIAEAERYIDDCGRAVVVKADGLAGGKGAIVTSSPDEAKAAARSMLVDRVFGDAGATIVVEDRLEGHEMSVHVITDGERSWCLPVSRDHKRIGDGDRGPNTGGMGAFAPVAADPALMQRIQDEVIEPTLAGMRDNGSPYRGVLYAGVMVAPDGTPNLLEHNVRFGDPETQVLMSLIDGDVGALMRSAARGELDSSAVSLPERHAVVLVLAAEGYPAAPRKGDAIAGLDAAEAVEGARVFHAGTRSDGDAVMTAGGRVLGVTAIGADLAEARTRAYRAAEPIGWAGMQMRNDIALSGLIQE